MKEKDTQIKGAITEQKCFLKCIEQGWIVSKPLFDNARYDFIADTGKQLLKIQVKTSTWTDDNHCAFTFNGYSQHSVGKGNKRMKYTNKEIDYFMTEKDGIFYLCSPAETGFVAKTLRLFSANPNNPQINWAKDYQFEEVIKGL